MTRPPHSACASCAQAIVCSAVAAEGHRPKKIRCGACPACGLLRECAAAQDCSMRSDEHTSELQSLRRISYAVFCLKKKNKHTPNYHDESSTTDNINSITNYIQK